MEPGDDDDGGGIRSLLVSSTNNTPSRRNNSSSRTSIDSSSSSSSNGSRRTSQDISEKEKERIPIYDGHKGYGSTSSLDNFLSGSRKFNLAPKGRSLASITLVDPAACKIEHEIQRSDTLQGISIKYGVSIDEIKRTNKLWSNNSLFARKSITIQVDPETYEKFSVKQGLTTKQEALQRVAEKREAAREEFKKKSNCTEDSVIDFYLDMFHFNVDRALRKFELDVAAESHRTGSLGHRGQPIDSSLLLPEDDFNNLRISGSLPNGNSLSAYRSHAYAGGYQSAAQQQSALERYYGASSIMSKKEGKQRSDENDGDNDLANASDESFAVHEAVIDHEDSVKHVSQEKQNQLQQGYDDMFDL